MTEAVDTGTAGDGGAPALETPGGVNPQAPIDAAVARLFKVKVDGQDTEVDETELLRGYTHSKVANERMRQATETRQLAEQVLSIFKTNPKEAFAKLGVDAKAFAEQVLQEEMEEAVLTPEQKELRDLKRFKEDMSQKEEAARQAEAEAAEEAFRTQVAEELQTSIVTALDSADLPRNEYTVARMAYYLESCIQAGFEATPQDVIAHVKAEYDRELKAFLSSVPEDKLLNFIGPDFTKKVVKQHIAATGAKKKAVTPTPVGVEVKKPEENVPTTPRDFFRKR